MICVVSRANISEETSKIQYKYGSQMFDQCFDKLTECRFHPGYFFRLTMDDILESTEANKTTLRVIVRKLCVACYNIMTQNLHIDMISNMSKLIMYNFNIHYNVKNNASPLTQDENECIQEIATLIARYYLEYMSKTYDKKLYNLVNTEKDDFLNITFKRQFYLNEITKEMACYIDSLSAAQLKHELKTCNFGKDGKVLVYFE